MRAVFAKFGEEVSKTRSEFEARSAKWKAVAGGSAEQHAGFGEIGYIDMSSGIMQLRVGIYCSVCG